MAIHVAKAQRDADQGRYDDALAELAAIDPSIELDPSFAAQIEALKAAIVEGPVLEDELARMSEVTLEELRAVHDAFPIRPRVIGRLTPASS